MEAIAEFPLPFPTNLAIAYEASGKKLGKEITFDDGRGSRLIFSTCQFSGEKE